MRYMTEIFYRNGKYYLYKDTLPEKLTSFTSVTPQPTYYMRQFLTARRRKAFDDSITKLALKRDTTSLIVKYSDASADKESVTDTSKKQKSASDSVKYDPYHQPVNINSYSFDAPSANPNKPTIKIIPPPKTVETIVVFPMDKTETPHKDTVVKKQILSKENYYVSFKPSYINTQLNNTYITNSYEPYSASAGPTILSPGLGFNLSLSGLQDLFEDYSFSGGVRMAPFSNSDYYLTYEDKSGRLGKELILHRGSFLGVAEGTYPANLYAMDATYKLLYPFSEVSRLEGSAGVLNEKNITLSVDVPSLETPPVSTYMPHLEADYVYDATIPAGLNIYSGLKARGFIQYYDDLSKVKTGMFIAGFDIRYYKKIHRELIWANRLSAGTSFGQEHLLYYMGGVDGWFNPTFSSITGVTPGQNYVFQTLATPLRGFDQNVRNGTNFLLYNTEIRFSIFRYLSNRPIKSDFLNNFQFITFLDVGTAWTGSTPYSTVNSINTTVVGAPGNPITVIISAQQYPFVEGFGEGIRTRILGYFVRLDEAWGINNGVISTTPTTYFSFSLDF